MSTVRQTRRRILVIISQQADGVFSRFFELQLQKMIQLSELPVVGTICTVYQSIGQQSQPKQLCDHKE